jgi:flagellar secretion chaperone FliS
MNQKEIASLYTEISATGANPAGGVLKLYERILEDFRRASQAIEAADVERRVTCLNHALLIIAELEGVLDLERGGDIAKHLRGFYQILRGLILQANIRANRRNLDELTNLVIPVRDAWQQVEKDFAANKVNVPSASPSSNSSAQTKSFSSQSDLEPVGSSWSA